MSSAPESRRLVVNGITLHVLVQGEGTDVLLVHGFPDDHDVWRHQVPALVRAGHRVIVPDLRGCGRSDMPAAVRDYRLPLLVSDLVGVLDALGARRVRLVGHDWGAVIAWCLCMTHPERVERYVALSVGHLTAYARGPLRQKLMAWYVVFFQLRGIAERLLKARKWRLLRALTGHHAEAARWTARLAQPGRLTAAINYYRANVGLLLGRALPMVSVPVVGVWSSGDRFLCEQQMLDSARWVAGPWRYVRLEGLSHWMQLDAPATVNRLLIDLLH